MHQVRTMDSMATNSLLSTVLITFFSIVSSVLLVVADNRKIYIIHMNQHAKPDSFSSHHQWYHSLVSSSHSIIYTYNTIFHGFAAYLDLEEVQSIKNPDTVIRVFEEKVYSIQTTHTPQYLGLNSNFNILEGGNFHEIEQASEDIIVGVFDTGVWHESKSFNDKGLPPIPKHWKGKCKSTKDFDRKLCNKKLIGARYYLAARKKTGKKDHRSARDYNGHGTHTASTKGGSPVANASMFGYARGTARGMAHRARIACYRVCGDNGGCNAADVLKGMEQAVKDGVDIMSLSLGVPATPYIEDPVAIGSFYAMRLGILVAMAATNKGPKRSTVGNIAPWVLTVAAGSINRDFPAYVVLGNKQWLSGISLYSKRRLGSKPLGLIYHKGNNSSSKYCVEGTLDPDLVRGKVVVCDSGGKGQAEKGQIVQRAGGAAKIMVRDDVAVKVLDLKVDLAPTMVVGKKAGDLIKGYIGSVANPTVKIKFGGTVLGVKPAAVVGRFSSRGPNPVSPEILKPDVMGPGVNILAAYSEAVAPTRLKEDKRVVKYVIKSGTSMACPHVAGVAALLKAAHPSWSPSAIKSAIMTTASASDNTNSPITDEVTAQASNPCAYGSGHIVPMKAFSPGLLYDISNQDYVTFLCSLDYPLSAIQAFAQDPNVTCLTKFISLVELNYLSFSVVFTSKATVKYTRELTNVGVAGSTYRVEVNVPPTVTVKVQPSVLMFKNVGDKQKYTITFAAKKMQSLQVKQQSSVRLSGATNNTKLEVQLQLHGHNAVLSLNFHCFSFPI